MAHKRMRARRRGGSVPIHWLRLLPVLLLAGVGAFVLATQFTIIRPVHPITRRVIPGIATSAAWMDREEREHEEAPDRALALVGIAPGMTVADVGAGTGYMTIRIARLVGPAGKVLATDLQPPMLELIEQKARRQRLANVETIQGAVDDARLPADAVDLVLLVDVYHELRHPQAMLLSIRRALKSNGRLVLIEYRKEDPDIPIASTHRLSVEEARAEIEAAGFKLDRTIEQLPRQHIIDFRKAP